MKVSEMAERLALDCLTPDVDLDGLPELTGGYASDLLSPPRIYTERSLLFANGVVVGVVGERSA